jgi:hypothetical protein
MAAANAVMEVTRIQQFLSLRDPSVRSGDTKKLR